MCTVFFFKPYSPFAPLAQNLLTVAIDVVIVVAAETFFIIVVIDWPVSRGRGFSLTHTLCPLSYRSRHSFCLFVSQLSFIQNRCVPRVFGLSGNIRKYSAKLSDREVSPC